MEQAFAELVQQNQAASVVHYLTRFGRVIDTDAAREFCAAYRASKQGRTRWSRATYKPAKDLAIAVYDHVLASAKFWNQKAQVIFTSGGSGSGKTTARSTIDFDGLAFVPSPDGKDWGVVVDGTLSNEELAGEQIGRALSDGHDVLVLHVVTDFETAVRRVINRAIKMGRTVALENLAMNHLQARVTFLALHARLADRVSFLCIEVNDNQEQKALSLEELRALPAMQFDVLRERAFAVLDDEHRNLKETHPEIDEALRQAGSRVA